MNKAETTAKVKGVITFNNGEVGTGDASLIKIDGTWYIEYFNADKKFQQSLNRFLR